MINHTFVPEITPLHKIDEIRCWENRPFTKFWPEPQLRKSRGVTRTIKKKHRKSRTTFTTQQLEILERHYHRNKYLDAELRQDLAKSLNIEEKCIRVWFQNRRMKEKRESSETSSDSSNDISNTVNSQQTTQYEFNQYIPPDHCAYGTNQAYLQNYNVPSTQTVPYNNQTFYYDLNVYPTQYYPNYCVEGTAFNTQGSETENYWHSIGYF